MSLRQQIEKKLQQQAQAMAAATDGIVRHPGCQWASHIHPEGVERFYFANAIRLGSTSSPLRKAAIA